MSFTIVYKIEVFVKCLKFFVNATLKKILNFETPCPKHLLSVHRGSSCVNFGEIIIIQLQAIANCDHCTTPLQLNNLPKGLECCQTNRCNGQTQQLYQRNNMRFLFEISKFFPNFFILYIIKILNEAGATRRLPDNLRIPVEVHHNLSGAQMRRNFSQILHLKILIYKNQKTLSQLYPLLYTPLPLLLPHLRP